MSNENDCLSAHRWLLAGDCPFCHGWISRGEVVNPQSTNRVDAERSWDVEALLTALESPDVGVRRCVMWLTRQHVSSLETVLLLLRKGLKDDDANVREQATIAIYLIGARLTPPEAGCLEQHLKARPDDLEARCLLLGYYTKQQYRYAELRPARQRHILWVIQNAPRFAFAGGPLMDMEPVADGVAYVEAKALWLRQVGANPTDPKVIGNAANCVQHEDVNLCTDLWRRCKALEPSEPRWRELLGYHLQRHGRNAPSEEEQRAAASAALVELEEAWGLTTDEADRFGLLDELAKTAIEAGEALKARRYAEALLSGAARPEFAEYAGGALHYGNLTLGRLALLEGNVETAKRNLIEAGQTTGSAPLQSFGPNMQLAKDLLERGERAAVLEYLRLCALFWHTPDQRIDQWIHTVEHGGIPDFGANLVY